VAVIQCIAINEITRVRLAIRMSFVQQFQTFVRFWERHKVSFIKPIICYLGKSYYGCANAPTSRNLDPVKSWTFSRMLMISTVPWIFKILLSHGLQKLCMIRQYCQILRLVFTLRDFKSGNAWFQGPGFRNLGNNSFNNEIDSPKCTDYTKILNSVVKDSLGQDRSGWPNASLRRAFSGPPTASLSHLLSFRWR
jgi:hypothetical protein